MEIIALQGHAKTGSGKEEVKKIRRNEQIPAVMYKSGGGEATQFALKAAEIRHLVYTSKFKLAEITLNGTMHKCIVKDIQFHPVTDAVLHLDFLELVPGVKFKATVPLRFAGQAPGVKEGGKFIPRLRQINILTTPERQWTRCRRTFLPWNSALPSGYATLRPSKVLKLPTPPLCRSLPSRFRAP